MTALTDHELLIRIDERVLHIKDEQEDIKKIIFSDEGTARCQLNRKEISDLRESFKWPKRAAVGAAVGVVMKVIWDGIAGFFTI